MNSWKLTILVKAAINVCVTIKTTKCDIFKLDLLKKMIYFAIIFLTIKQAKTKANTPPLQQPRVVKLYFFSTKFFETWPV